MQDRNKRARGDGLLAHRHKKTFLLTTMVLPGALWLILLRYLPMFGIVIAFKEYRVYMDAPGLINNVIHSQWVGFKNFAFLFASSDAGSMIFNTLSYNLVFILLGLVLSVTLAIMLNEITHKFLAKTFQTMMFFPYFISWVVVSYFVFAFLAPNTGMLAGAIKDAGGNVANWYGDPRPWPVILTIANVWKNTGYSCILYLAAVTGIDAAQYEAASIDGATKWQQIRHVTLPHLKTMIIILLIMNVGRIFNADFGLFYSVPMNMGPLYPATRVIDTFVYNAMKATSNLGMATAAGLFQNVVGFICIMGTNAIVNKVDPDSALF